MDEQVLQQQILSAFEYSYKYDDWVNPLDEALAGATAEEAAWRPGPEGKGIWDIVLHMAVWNENIVARIRSGERERPAEGAWPPLPAVKDEATWAQSKQRLLNSLDLIHAEIESTLPEGLQGPYGLADLFCRFNHIAYHIGQITKMRELRARSD